jgi:hypothetical protein
MASIQGVGIRRFRLDSAPRRSQVDAGLVGFVEGGGLEMGMGAVEFYRVIWYNQQRPAISHQTSLEKDLLRLTQLFLNREIWGMDAACVNQEEMRNQIARHGFEWIYDRPYIASHPVETNFAQALGWK